MSAVERIGEVGTSPGQEERIREQEARLLACPFCGSRQARFRGIDSYGRFSHVKCSNCGAEASPKVWQKRVAAEQRSLFGGGP